VVDAHAHNIVPLQAYGDATTFSPHSLSFKVMLPLHSVPVFEEHLFSGFEITLNCSVLQTFEL